MASKELNDAKFNNKNKEEIPRKNIDKPSPEITKSDLEKDRKEEIKTIKQQSLKKKKI